MELKEVGQAEAPLEKTKEKMQNRINNGAELTKKANDNVVSILNGCTNEKGLLDASKIRAQKEFKEVPKDQSLVTDKGTNALSSTVADLVNETMAKWGKSVGRELGGNDVEFLVNQKLNAIVRNLEDPIIRIPGVYKKMPSVTLTEATSGFQDENARIDQAKDKALERINTTMNDNVLGKIDVQDTTNKLINVSLQYKHYSLGTYHQKNEFMGLAIDKPSLLRSGVGYNSRI